MSLIKNRSSMKSNLLWLLFLLLTFLVTLPITWVAMSKVDFFYSSLHDAIGIDEHIQRFAPSNRFNKLEFEKTSKQQRVELFHQVGLAIHNNGKGLESLSYLRKSTNQRVLLFTEAEVTHLKDVATLLNKLKPVIFALMFTWLMLLAWILLKRIKLPSLKRFVVLAVILNFGFFSVLLLGPETVFNQLHIWAFPDNHQWFFYYEDSLMSTMMKAPYLFGYISAIWLVLSMLLTFFLIKLLHLLQNSVNPSAT